MMTDRELLEAAAKAADIELGADRTDCGVSISENGRHRSLPRWNPLEDDGDALRLAVKLNIWPVRRTFASAPDIIAVQPGEAYWDSLADEDIDGEALAATRRAIVRAAAAIVTARASESS